MGEVEIEIGADGKVVVRTKGVKGPRCLQYTQFIQELVGRETSRTLTSEYYEPEGQVRIQAEQRQSR
ncbi:MAG: DUF2997 domain-containing protein [Planctomycetes bacterium]|nr:DUF2997 domain-containing protein [Planctomycetota bacterium]